MPRMKTVEIQVETRNRQRKWPVATDLVSHTARWACASIFKDTQVELSIQLLAPGRMAQINWDYLKHQGPTDVITFDLSDEEVPELLVGEILICPEVAARQAKVFETTWQEELFRYLIHGLLHLKGFDDKTSDKRHIMKHHENKWLEKLTQAFEIHPLPIEPHGLKREISDQR